jgi:hypothetical protein
MMMVNVDAGFDRRALRFGTNYPRGGACCHSRASKEAPTTQNRFGEKSGRFTANTAGQERRRRGTVSIAVSSGILFPPAN